MQGIGLFVTVASFASGIGFASRYSVPLGGMLFLVLVLLLFFGAFSMTRRGAYLMIALALLAGGAGALRVSVEPRELPSDFAPLLEQKGTFEGTLVTQPDVRETSIRLTVEVEREGAATRVLAVAPPHGEYLVGDRLKVTGTLTLPEPFATDGGRTFAYDDFLAKDGVFALVQPAHAEVVGRDASPVLTLLRLLQRIRDGFLGALGRALPEPESALATGLIAGGKQGLGKELLDDFTTAGLIHIVVLSGYNVMIIAEAIVRSARFLPKRVALLLAGVSIALFVLAAGTGAAALRAGAMALLGLLARATGRTYAVLRALGVVLALMLLWNPLLLMYDPGFQFSFVATLGLILLAPRFERAFLWMRFPTLRDIAASTFAAQIAVLPILLYHTGNLSLVSFLVNLAVLPVIPPAMFLGAVAGLAGAVAPAALDALVLLLGLPAYVLLAYVIGAAQFAADLPLASVGVPAFSFWIVVLAYGALALFIWKENARAFVRAFRSHVTYDPTPP